MNKPPHSLLTTCLLTSTASLPVQLPLFYLLFPPHLCNIYAVRLHSRMQSNQPRRDLPSELLSTLIISALVLTPNQNAYGLD